MSAPPEGLAVIRWGYQSGAVCDAVTAAGTPNGPSPRRLRPLGHVSEPWETYSKGRTG